MIIYIKILLKLYYLNIIFSNVFYIMLRTFIDPNGNIQFIPNIQLSQIKPVISTMNPYFYNDPYSNSSLIIQKLNNNNNNNDDDNNNDNNSDSFMFYQRPIFYSDQSKLDVNNDPELRRRMVRFIYDKFKNSWLSYSFLKLQKYLTNNGTSIDFVKNINDYDKESTNDDKKVDFILENVFGKHEVLLFLDKFVKNHQVNWYDIKTKHIDRVKSELYDKLKNHMKRIVIDKL